jgi:hypothetical protein
MEEPIQVQPVVQELFILRRFEVQAPTLSMLMPVAFGFIILLLWLMFSPRRRESVLLTYMGFLFSAALPVVVPFLMLVPEMLLQIPAAIHGIRSSWFPSHFMAQAAQGALAFGAVFLSVSYWRSLDWLTAAVGAALGVAAGAVAILGGPLGFTILLWCVLPILVSFVFRYWFSRYKAIVFGALLYGAGAVALLSAARGDLVTLVLAATIGWIVVTALWYLACLAFAAITGELLFVALLLGVSALSAGYFLIGAFAGMLLVASWWYILVPILAIGLFYIGMMYLKDARSVHPAIAGLLGFLRCLVYAIIATVFLLPGCQTFNVKEFHSKSLMLVDVSRSMDLQDALVRDDQPSPRRKDKVLDEWLVKTDPEGKTFFERLNARTPLTVYSFGSMLDERGSRTFEGKQTWEADKLRAELRPLVDPRKDDFKPAKGASPDKILADKEQWHGYIDNLTARSNYGGALYQLARLEGNADLQALILVGDGASNLGSDETLRDALALFTQRKRPVPIITIGVGSYERPAEIRVEEPVVPEFARPDDKFLVRVPVIGTNLVDEEFSVTLKLRRKFKLDDPDNELVDEPVYDLGPVKAKFEGVGDNPRNQIDFEIDIEKLKGIKASDEEKSHELEGKWEFIAVVPRHPRESTREAEHRSAPVEVVVQKRKMRVLLFSGGPSREYQMLRTALFREVQAKRLDMSIYLQNNEKDYVDQDVEADRFLQQFPTSLVPAAGIGKYMALTDYDVIIAVDVDWTMVPTPQLENLKEWVGKYAGGVVFVAGPIHTYSLARPGGVDITPLKTIFPVELKDSRLHRFEHDATRKWALNFPLAAENYDFLKLDEKSENHLQGWENFFWGTKGKPVGADARPKNGFFNYYPVERLRTDSYVMATFAGPVASRINEGKDEQPFFVGMRYGTGRCVYLGSSETWRLIHYNAEYHKRFWIKLMRHVGANTAPQKKYGSIIMARSAPAGAIPIEAIIKGADLLPARRDTLQRVHVKLLDDPKDEDKKPEEKKSDEIKTLDMDAKKPEAKKKDERKQKSIFDLKAKGTKDDGSFDGTLVLHVPGTYEVSIPIEGTNQSLSAKLTVRAPDPETDNKKPELERLFHMASDVSVLLKSVSMPQAAKDKILEIVTGDKNLDNKNKKTKLYFTLQEADKIDQILTTIAPRQINVKGKQYDLWDKFWKPDWISVSSFWAAVIGPWVVALIGLAILLIVRNYMGALAFALGFGLLSLVPLFVNFSLGWSVSDWPYLPFHVSAVLVAVVGLLAIEWFLRKLLKLA